MSIYRKLLKNFEGRYQLIIRNIENFAEYVSIPFSYSTIVACILIWFSASIGLSLWLAKTVLAKWMNPVYIETENRNKICSLTASVKELEQHIEFQTKFITTLQRLIQGKSHIAHIPQPPPPSTPPTSAPAPAPTFANTPSAAANLSSKESDTKHNLDSPATPPLCNVYFSPIKGCITNAFNRKSRHYGIDIVAKEKDPIKSIATGIVFFSDWSVDTGWVIAIQHHNNLISIYKHCAILFKKVGNLVRAGDVIALMGNSGEISTGPHLHFELWYQGIALNPEEFIKF